MQDVAAFILDEDDDGTECEFGTVLDEEVDMPEHPQNEHCKQVFHSHGKRIKKLEEEQIKSAAKTRLLLGLISIFGAALLVIGWDIGKGIHNMSLQIATLTSQVATIEKRMDK